MFAVGDIADSGEFGLLPAAAIVRAEADPLPRTRTGAPKAARPGMVQAAIVSRNIASLLSSSSSPTYESYTPDPAAIHLTLGPEQSIVFRNPPSSDPARPLETFVGEPITFAKGGSLDMNIDSVWERRAPGLVKSDEDYWL